MRSRRRGAQNAGGDPAGEDADVGPSASKRARVDPNEQVKALFGANVPVAVDSL